MVHRLRAVVSPASKDRRWLVMLIPGNSQEKAGERASRLHFVPPWAQHCPPSGGAKVREEQGEPVSLSEPPPQPHAAPACRASRGAQHAGREALPHPESPRYSRYINNEGIPERWGNAKEQSSAPRFCELAPPPSLHPDKALWRE